MDIYINIYIYTRCLTSYPCHQFNAVLHKPPLKLMVALNCNAVSVIKIYIYLWGHDNLNLEKSYSTHIWYKQGLNQYSDMTHSFIEILYMRHRPGDPYLSTDVPLAQAPLKEFRTHYHYMTVWILAGNYISFTIAAGLMRLHMPGVKKSRV